MAIADRFTAAKEVDLTKDDFNKWVELLRIGDPSSAHELTEIREQLMNEWTEHNNQLVRMIGNFQTQKLRLEHSVESINRWNLVFLVLSIIITLMKDLFV